MVKLSVLSLYRRILGGVQSSVMIKVNWVVFTIVGMNTTANVLVAAFQCRPIVAAFRSSAKGTCINASAFYLGNAITGIITDTMVYLLAVPIVKPLQMDQKRKAVTLLTLLVGALYVCLLDQAPSISRRSSLQLILLHSAVVTSCVRLGFLPALLTNPDTSWAMGVPMDWSMVEPTVGIIVSSIPAITSIRHFFRKDGQHSSANDPSLRSGGHIKLHDFGDHRMNNATSVTAPSAPWRHHADGGDTSNDSGSEERLVYGGKPHNTISQTMEVEVSYETKDV